MSIRVLIADDEYFIRQRLKKIIPWTTLNLTFAGEAENGQEVIDALKNSTIDIVILDIKMPKLTGIQAAEYIYDNYPMTKIIILSGYNDFEYARTALRYGVTDYLLKPVEEQALKSSLEDCIDKIIFNTMQHIKIQKYYHYEKCMVLSNIQNGNLSPSHLYSSYPEFKEFLLTLYIGIYIFDETETMIHLLITQLRESDVQCEYTQESEYIYTIQFFLKIENLTIIIHRILEEFIEREKQYVFFYIGNPFSLTDNWSPHFREGMDGVKQRYFSNGLNSISKQRPLIESGHIDEIPKIRQNITLLLNSQNDKDFSAYVNQLFERVQNYKETDYLYSIVTELFMTYHIYYHIPEGNIQNINEFITNILDEEYILENLKNTTIQYGLQCMKSAETSPSDVALCKKLMTFIEENYKMPDLSVAKLADFYQLNPSYIGTVFKKVNNISILQYITNVRLEAAKVLLESNQYKITEIADMIGYSDVFYFSKRFKKSYGTSPKDYALRLK